MEGVLPPSLVESIMEDIIRDLYCPQCGNRGMRPLSKSQNAQSGKTRYSCQGCGHRTTGPYTKPPFEFPDNGVRRIKKARRLLVSSVLNNTPLPKDCLPTLEVIAKEFDAEIVLIPTYFKNKVDYPRGSVFELSYPEEALPYILNKDVQVGKSLIIRASTQVRHQAVNPLGGMNHAGDTKSEIFGHAQLALEEVPTHKGQFPKTLMTTGTISEENYDNSSSGKKARFHHNINALFIEVQGSKYWDTQVSFDGKGAHLFDKYYTPRGSKASKGIEALIFGDTHKRFLRKSVETALDSSVEILKPKLQVFHDLHDHHIGSHHTEGDVIFNLKKSLTGEVSIRKELMMSVKHLEGRKGAVVVDSNHHRHLDQWFKRYNPRGNDVVNLELYNELHVLLREDLEKGGDGNLFRLFVEKYCKTPVRFVGGNDEFFVKGIDLSQHGDRGPNGARGSAKAFSKTGNKSVVGHGHTRCIEKGCWMGGTSAEEMPYAVGYGSWSCAHTGIYSNGKRFQFKVINGQLSPLMRSLT